MVQFFLNGEEKDLSQNIVIGDERNFIKVIEGNTTVFQRTIQEKNIFEYIIIHNNTTIYHRFLNTEGAFTIPDKCQGVECKLGSIEPAGDSYHIYIKMSMTSEIGYAMEEIEEYTVFDINTNKTKQLKSPEASFSTYKVLKL